jgi:hypothetical protein
MPHISENDKQCFWKYSWILSFRHTEPWIPVVGHGGESCDSDIMKLVTATLLVMSWWTQRELGHILSTRRGFGINHAIRTCTVKWSHTIFILLQHHLYCFVLSMRIHFKFSTPSDPYYSSLIQMYLDTKICLDTSILAKSIMGQREYYYYFLIPWWLHESMVNLISLVCVCVLI